MTDGFLSDDRTKVLRRLLYVVLAFAVVLVVLGLPLVFGDYLVYGLIVLGTAVVIGVLGWLALGAIRDGAPWARRLCIATGAATIVLSIPLVPIWIGLLTVITGIGVLVITFAPEQEAS
jgi:hypothetical protein